MPRRRLTPSEYDMYIKHIERVPRRALEPDLLVRPRAAELDAQDVGREGRELEGGAGHPREARQGQQRGAARDVSRSGVGIGVCRLSERWIDGCSGAVLGLAWPFDFGWRAHHTTTIALHHTAPHLSGSSPARIPSPAAAASSRRSASAALASKEGRRKEATARPCFSRVCVWCVCRCSRAAREQRSSRPARRQAHGVIDVFGVWYARCTCVCDHYGVALKNGGTRKAAIRSGP